MSYSKGDIQCITIWKQTHICRSMYFNSHNKKNTAYLFLLTHAYMFSHGSDEI